MTSEEPVWKLTLAYLGWLLAASALALLLGLVTAEVVALTGLVDSLSQEQKRVVEVVAIAGFIALALLPFLLRRHVVRSDEQPD